MNIKKIIIPALLCAFMAVPLAAQNEQVDKAANTLTKSYNEQQLQTTKGKTFSQEAQQSRADITVSVEKTQYKCAGSLVEGGYIITVPGCFLMAKQEFFVKEEQKQIKNSKYQIKQNPQITKVEIKLGNAPVLIYTQNPFKETAMLAYFKLSEEDMAKVADLKKVRLGILEGEGTLKDLDPKLQYVFTGKTTSISGDAITLKVARARSKFSLIANKQQPLSELVAQAEDSFVWFSTIPRDNAFELKGFTSFQMQGEPLYYQDILIGFNYFGQVKVPAADSTGLFAPEITAINAASGALDMIDTADREKTVVFIKP